MKQAKRKRPFYVFADLCCIWWRWWVQFSMVEWLKDCFKLFGYGGKTLVCLERSSLPLSIV